MWLLTKTGFFSAVRDLDTRDSMIIRARDPDDMKNLVEQYVPGTEIIETLDSDYRYRIRLDKSTWIRLAAELAEDVDYNNFKNHIKEVQGVERAMLYSEIWEILYSLQPLSGKSST
jgi:hypothetical protein